MNVVHWEIEGRREVLAAFVQFQLRIGNFLVNLLVNATMNDVVLVNLLLNATANDVALPVHLLVDLSVRLLVNATRIV